ncbi:MAG TPA: hypothetical protein VEC11_13915 [Allosphingosinicella sp.]|nr:hypothetical protein [Allosphingosinicella sp.]
MARKPSPAPKRAYVRVTSWRRRRFLALLEETGTVKVAAELAGLGIGAIYRLRKLEPGFRERMEAAISIGSKRLAEWGSPDSPTPDPSPEGEGDYAGLVPRRGQGGRVRLVSPGQRWWEPRHDEIFLLALRGTGNVEASARAAGFTARTAHNQMKKRPGFAKDCERAIAEARPRLEDLLALQSVRWSRAAYDEAFEGEPLDERDVDRALRTLEYWEREKRRRDARG